MNFVLQRDRPYNTIIALPDGTHIYRIQAQDHIFRKGDTIISKFCNVAAYDQAYWQRIANIKSHIFDSDEVYLGGRSLFVTTSTSIDRYRVSFKASDGKVCQWITKLSFLSTSHFHLLDSNKQELASYFHPNCIGRLKGGSAMLNVTTAGIPILDEIIVTFAYAEAKRRQRSKRDSGAATVASSAAL